MNFLPYIFILFPFFLFSQIVEVEKDSTDYDYYIIEGDSIPRETINLDEVYVLNKLKFDKSQLLSEIITLPFYEWLKIIVLSAS